MPHQRRTASAQPYGVEFATPVWGAIGGLSRDDFQRVQGALRALAEQLGRSGGGGTTGAAPGGAPPQPGTLRWLTLEAWALGWRLDEVRRVLVLEQLVPAAAP